MPCFWYKRHQFFVLLLLLRISHPHALVLFVQRVDLRLQGRHLGHGPHARVAQRQHQEIDDDGHSDNRPAPVADQVVVHPVQPQEQRFGDKPEPSPVDDLVQFRVRGAQHVEILGTHEKLQFHVRLAAHGRADMRDFVPFGLEPVGILPDLEIERSSGLGQQHAREIGVLQTRKLKTTHVQDRPVLGHLGVFHHQLVIGAVEVHGVLLRGLVVGRPVAEAGAPGQQVRQARVRPAPHPR